MKTLVIALALAATTTLAFGHGHGGPGRRHGTPVADHLAQLGLSDAQKQQIGDIRKADAEKNRSLYANFHAKRMELRDLKQTGDPKAETLKAELEALGQQLKAAKEAVHAQVLNVLTPEQRTKLEQMKGEHKRPR
jgi:Spy/CpxP family protein refolding chaperone